MSFRDGKWMNYAAAVLDFNQEDIFPLNVYANEICGHLRL